MNLTEQQLDLVDRYLRSEFEEVDQQEWDLMMSHPNIKDEVLNLLHIQKAIKLEGRDALKEQIIGWDGEEEKGGKIRTLKIWPLAVAASILLVVALGILVLWPKSISGDLYASNYEAYPNVVAPIKKGDVPDDDYARAFQLYESKSYSAAGKLFSKLDQKDPNVMFYSSLVFMEQNNFKRASRKLSRIVNKKDHQYFQQSQWYLAWCQFKNGEIDAAKEIFQSITDQEDHLFNKKAIEVIKEFDR